MFSNMNKENIAEFYLPLLMVVFGITLLVYYIQWKYNRKHLNELAAKIPSPDHITLYPIIGHALEFLGDSEKILKSIQNFNKLGPSRPQSAWLAYRYFTVVNRPEDMEVILNSPKCLSKDNLYKMSVPLAGLGLFALPVPTWKKHRKIIMPAFNQKILDNFVEVFYAQAEICVQQLYKSNGKIVDAFPYVAKYSLDAVSETAMGVKINAQTTESDIEAGINRGLEIVMLRMFNVPYHSDFIFGLTTLAREQKKLVDKYHHFINTVIRQKREEFKQNQLERKNDTQQEEGLKRKAFLDLLIEYTQDGETWTEYEFMSEVATFMIAGSDTGATVGGFTFLLLSMHPEIQEKCYEEVMEVVGPNRAVTHADLPKFVYLEKVIKESMRLFPVGPTIVRKVDEDVEVGGYVFPKGAGIVLSIMSMHHSEKYYKDPFKFDPERFSPEETAKRHKYAYLPFSAGPRNCVGPKYGMMSLKTLISVILRKFRVESDYKDIRSIRVKQSLIIKPVDGFPLRFIPRK